MCKTTLPHHSARMAVNEFVEQSVRRMLPAEYADRQKVFEEEMTEMAGRPQDGKVTVPSKTKISICEKLSFVAVFVCTMSFPNIPCPLHVFEPRYRLMIRSPDKRRLAGLTLTIRRVMEAGTREFGMCTNSPDKP